MFQMLTSHFRTMLKYNCKKNQQSCCTVGKMQAEIFHRIYDEWCGKIDLFRVKTGLHMSYNGVNAVRYIKQRGYFMKDGRIYGYFDTKYMTISQTEQNVHNIEDQKIANFLTLNTEQVNFRVTLVIYTGWFEAYQLAK